MKKPSLINRFTSMFKSKKEIKTEVAMSDLLICMNQHPNDYEFGGEARVIIQKFAEDLED